MPLRPSERAGGWLFRHRGWTPVPVFAAAVAVSRPTHSSWVVALALIAAGEALRLVSVRHIGPACRTRGPDPGDLVRSGPYRRLRNPLYLANLLVASGFGVASGRGAVAVAVTGLSAVQYALIVRWEEARLSEAHGAAWEAYRSRVPRWGWPPGPGAGPPSPPRLSVAQAFRTERSTLLTQFAVLAAIALRGAPWGCLGAL